MIQGFIINSILCSVIFIIFFLGYPFRNEMKIQYAYLFLLPAVLLGILQGYLAGGMWRSRFQKLFLLAVFLVYLFNIGQSAILYFPKAGNAFLTLDTWKAIMIGANTNFILFGFITLPYLLISTFLIEIWVEPTR
ncbi:MAG TPA: hypothetical protein PK453_13895 [Leptospiraceae bacterium]|nr:hypothetical protein [Leptospiraceae bacterium]HNF14756.1 hypothetical protein [Leptospiraceae bacterium]HNF25585.1 hypothetical protein [Leptospiraceae bacterium]HNH07402.1 hypothetical protein [Leptospiraceae bacterium]HNI24949.1 hypothetical protein [Leptospiraceae bacterium]